MTGIWRLPPEHPRERVYDRSLTPYELDGIARSFQATRSTNIKIADGYLRWFESGVVIGVLRCPYCGRLHQHGFDRATFSRLSDCRLVPRQEYQIRWHAPGEIPSSIEQELQLPHDSLIEDGFWCRHQAAWLRQKALSALTSREVRVLRGILDRYVRSPVFQMALCERLNDFPSAGERKGALRDLVGEVMRRHARKRGPGRTGWARRLETAADALHHAAQYGSLW
ncbi:hypothetical protein [Methylopila sp. Yamaguchi]|uniref:hypothetical protein n=1 Tax=Methylopila sp. Yamaguchi TaxID=1437817 RepID=UPI000CC3807E|nr:hypothetical protein [Methylopila sp. Yamaguchi]GBD50244.1 hypothetical protein METY_3457 [Methylopila sp. Yamaguchi]